MKETIDENIEDRKLKTAIVGPMLNALIGKDVRAAFSKLDEFPPGELRAGPAFNLGFDIMGFKGSTTTLCCEVVGDGGEEPQKFMPWMVESIEFDCDGTPYITLASNESGDIEDELAQLNDWRVSE